MSMPAEIPSGLTMEQMQVVQIALSDPLILDAILRAVEGTAPPGASVPAGGLGEEPEDLEKRILGSAKKGK